MRPPTVGLRMRCARAAVRAATALCLHRPGVPRATLLLTKLAVVPASPNNEH